MRMFTLANQDTVSCYWAIAVLSVPVQSSAVYRYFFTGRVGIPVLPQVCLLFKSSLRSQYCNYCYSYVKYPPSALLTYSVHNVSATSHSTSLLFSGSALHSSLHVYAVSRLVTNSPTDKSRLLTCVENGHHISLTVSS